jgi:hypothetical protein
MSEILTLPLEYILHILTYFDDVRDHINVSSALNRQELHEEYQYYTYRKKINIIIKTDIENIKEIEDLKYIYNILTNKQNNTYSIDICNTNGSKISGLKYYYKFYIEYVSTNYILFNNIYRLIYS